MEAASAIRAAVPEPAELIARARAMIPALVARSAEQLKRRSSNWGGALFGLENKDFLL